METMASQLLDLTRSRLGGGFHLERSKCDIVALVTELLDEFRAVQPDRKVRCELPAHAEGVFDRSKIAQVLSNLIRNAYEYAPKGTPIDITVREKSDSISVDVTNAGPAIADAVQSGLFDPFRPGRKASSNGLGLGLFIAREIAVAHGGTVSFTSKEGATRFTVELPRLPRD
jgi:signal transduction histidine kinase